MRFYSDIGRSRLKEVWNLHSAKGGGGEGSEAHHQHRTHQVLSFYRQTARLLLWEKNDSVHFTAHFEKLSCCCYCEFFFMLDGWWDSSSSYCLLADHVRVLLHLHIVRKGSIAGIYFLFPSEIDTKFSRIQPVTIVTQNKRVVCWRFHKILIGRKL